MKVLVIGGTGVISRAIVNELIINNHEVSIFNRANKKLDFIGSVEQLTGDRRNHEAFQEIMNKRNFDVVIDMISFNAEDAKTTVEIFKDRVGQIIITSSVAAYKRPYNSLPIKEDAEELNTDPAFEYSYYKAEMERYLNKIIREENLPITIVRPSLTYGIGAQNIGVLRQNYGIVDRIRKGKPLVMFGDGTNPWSFTFAPDLAKGYLGLVGNEKAFGEAYHITNEERTMWQDLYIEIGKIIGIEPKIVHIPSEVLHKASPTIFGHLYYEKSYAGIFDNSKIKRDVPEFKTEISLNSGLRSIIDWFEKEANTVDIEKDRLEDKLVELHNDCLKQMIRLNI